MEYTCKYCLEDINLQTDKENIVSPCDCKGSMNYIHIDCFKNVTRESCEICGIKYPIISQPTINFNTDLVFLINALGNENNEEVHPEIFIARLNIINNFIIGAIYNLYVLCRNYSIISKLQFMLQALILNFLYNITWISVFILIQTYCIIEMIIKPILGQNISTIILSFIKRLSNVILIYLTHIFYKYINNIKIFFNMITNPYTYFYVYIFYIFIINNLL